MRIKNFMYNIETDAVKIIIREPHTLKDYMLQDNQYKIATNY